MKVIACLALAALLPVAAIADCKPIVADITYCSDLRERNAFATRAAMPDLVTTFVLQDDPLVSSHIAVMPIDRDIASWDDVFDMVTFQIMGKGTARFHELSDFVSGPGKIVGADTMRTEMLGRHKDGDVMAAIMVDALPLQNNVLLVYTVQEKRSKSERVEVVEQPLRDLHIGSLAQFRSAE
ncbi:hypothetical protein [uncultured Tateyamaria sp.]|uniref:hypothetical protein n=1 Tax=uncultured Tateyamaria sp. TaxID=455651 RepID=UPI002637B509|nr:hypothetical protein [uncultured Tateyamaria sp.]